MNDKPTRPFRSGLRYRLVPGGPTARLAFEPAPPMVGASIADRLLVAARDATHGKVRVFSVDPGGQLSNVSEMPLDDVSDMVRCGGRVVLLGERRSQWHCLTLDVKCEVITDAPLPIKDPPVLSPCSVPDSDPPAHVWINAQDRLVIARGMRSVTVPLLFREKEHLLALWVSRPRQAICIQVFSESLTPCRGVRELIKAGTPQSFYWIGGFRAEDRGLVLAWQTGPGDETVLGEGAFATRHEYHFALLDPRQGMLSEPISLYGAAECLFVGGWAENSFIVVLGGTGHASVFHIQSVG